MEVGTVFRKINLPYVISWYKCGFSLIIFLFRCGAFEKGQVVQLKKKKPVKEKEVESESSKITKPTQVSKFNHCTVWRGSVSETYVCCILRWAVFFFFNLKV